MKKMYFVIVALATLFACSNPAVSITPTRGASGELVVSSVRPEGNGLQASTVFPEFELGDVASYTVALTNGPGDTSSHSTTVNTNGSGDFAEEVAFTDLIPGRWTLSVTGRNSDAEVVLFGSQSVFVAGGERRSFVVPVRLLEGENDLGRWAATFTWPQELLGDGDFDKLGDITGYRVSIQDAVSQDVTVITGTGSQTLEGTGIAVFFAPEDQDLTITADDQTSQSFWLTVELLTDRADPFQVLARYDERWYVRGNLTSSTAVTFAESDFSFGGGATIALDLSDLDRFEELTDNYFFETPGSSVAAGETFTIQAAGLDNVTFGWRMNGEAIADATSNTLSIETTAAEAGQVKRITLVVTAADGTRYSAGHSVRIIAVED
ncbi:MAG: hypothetical protein EA383_17510 [Spirochaetaceae bacterium]|nr:MAG: hypothetical protein EA383_17510 [Spirochaetaceae bacterium]